MTHLYVNPNMIPPGTLSVHQYVHHQFCLSNHQLKFMVKIPTSIPVHNFLKQLLSVHTSFDSSVDPSGSLSITSSPSAENPLKIPCNHGEKMWLITCMKSKLTHHPSIHCALCLSLHLSMHHLFHPSINQTTNVRKSQTNSLVLIMGRKTLSKITIKIHDDVTLTLQNAIIVILMGQNNWLISHSHENGLNPEMNL